MEPVALSVAFLLGFVGGFKHAFEPDHVVAVSTLMHREARLPKVLQMGLSWGAGHTTTLVLGVLLIGLLRLEVTEAQLGWFELPVAFMLLALGGWAVATAVQRWRSLRMHQHDGVAHLHVGAHPHPHDMPLVRSSLQGYLVGMVHGMAGSGSLLLLVAATLPTQALGVVYALVYGLGSILGMGAVTALLAVPFLGTKRARPGFYHGLTALSGVLSVVLGMTILLELF